MSYRKFKADYLFDGLIMRRNDHILICRPDGTIEDLVEESQAGGDLEKYPGMITPGFINCHCHLELSYMEGRIPEKKGLVNFVLSVMSQRNQTEEGKQDAILSAETSMLRNGIVAVGDICNGPDTLDAKSSRRLDYYNFIELLGWAPEQADARFESARRLCELFGEKAEDKNHISLNPHAPYSVSDELWKRMSAGFPDKTISIHNQESATENEFFLSGTGDFPRMYAGMKIDSSHFKFPGTNSLSYFLPKLKSASKILLVHNTYTDEQDLLAARDFSDQIFYCFCPNANLYIEDRLPDIPVFLKHHSRMVLGTDSLASNHQLSILEEMKTIKKSFPSVPTAELLIWATSNGANALSYEEKLGDFSKGKKPGVVLIENLVQGEITDQSISRRLL